MAKPREVQIAAVAPARLAPLIGTERAARFEAIAAATRALLAGRAVANVNSTATGGGVAEMLQTLLAYARGAGIDARWLVMEGNAEFFALTKRLHNFIHGAPGDGGPLGAAERAVYEEVSRSNAHELLATLRPRRRRPAARPADGGAGRRHSSAPARHVVWRSHIGRDEPNAYSERGWAFLEPYLAEADAYVFTREAYAPSWLDRGRLRIIAPSLDPFSPKNVDLAPAIVLDVLAYAGLLDGARRACEPCRSSAVTAPRGRLDRHADVVQTGPPPPVRRPARRPGVALGPPEGHAGRDGGIRRAPRRVDRRALLLAGPTWPA